MSRPNNYSPIILDLKNPQDYETYQSLLQSQVPLTKSDLISEQIIDLIKCRYPHRRGEINKDFLKQNQDLVNEITLDTNLEHYGRWVYYSWSSKLVHVLAPKEFNELITNRNKNKINEAEQNKVSSLKIGIVGLTVGNIIARTLALEGLFAELRIADFDTLDLSGISDLGLKKIILTARQLFEINPYLNIKIFSSGIDESNIEEFVSADANLDFIIDECDALKTKFLIREYAKLKSIPVLMYTSKHGILDIERFDLEKNRRLFQDCSESIRSKDISSSSSAFVAPFLESDASLYVGSQLSSDLISGGSAIVSTIRLISQGFFIPSGQKHLDMPEGILNDGFNIHTKPRLAEIENYETETIPIKVLPEHIRIILENANLTPSSANNQDWIFSYADNIIFVAHNKNKERIDFHRDPALSSVGAVLAGIKKSANYLGFDTKVSYHQLNDTNDIFMSIELIKFDSHTEHDKFVSIVNRDNSLALPA